MPADIEYSAGINTDGVTRDFRTIERKARQSLRDVGTAWEEHSRKAMRTTSRLTQAYQRNARTINRAGTTAFTAIGIAVGIAAKSISDYERKFPELGGSMSKLRKEADAFYTSLGRDLSSSNVAAWAADALHWMGRVREASVNALAGPNGRAIDRESAFAEQQIRSIERSKDARQRGLEHDAAMAALNNQPFTAERIAARAARDRALREAGRDPSLGSTQRLQAQDQIRELFESTIADINRREGLDVATRAGQSREMSRSAREREWAFRRETLFMGRETDAAGMSGFERRRAEARLDRDRSLAELEGAGYGPGALDERRGVIESRYRSDLGGIRRDELDADKQRRELEHRYEVEQKLLRIQNMRAGGKQREADIARVTLDYAERERAIRRDQEISESVRRGLLEENSRNRAGALDALGVSETRTGRGSIASGVGLTASLGAQVFGGSIQNDPVLAVNKEQAVTLRNIEDILRDLDVGGTTA